MTRETIKKVAKLIDDLEWIQRKIRKINGLTRSCTVERLEFKITTTSGTTYDDFVIKDKNELLSQAVIMLEKEAEEINGEIYKLTGNIA